MSLTLRQNGLGQSNIVTATWWNDYYNLLTGVMTDQPVTHNYRPGASTGTPSLALWGNGNAPLLVGYDTNNTTARLTVDHLGHITIANDSTPGNQPYIFTTDSHSGKSWGQYAMQDGSLLWQETVGGVFVLQTFPTGQVNLAAGKASFNANGSLTITPLSGEDSLTVTSVSGGNAIRLYGGAATHPFYLNSDMAGGGFSLFDGDNNGYALIGVKAGHNVMTNRNGTVQANQVFTGATTPVSPNVGDIWLNA